MVQKYVLKVRHTVKMPQIRINPEQSSVCLKNIIREGGRTNNRLQEFNFKHGFPGWGTNLLG